MQAHCDGFIRGTAKEGGDRAIPDWTHGWKGQGWRPGVPNEGVKVRAQPLSLGTHGLVDGTVHKLSLSLLPKCDCGADQKPGRTAWRGRGVALLRQFWDTDLPSGQGGRGGLDLPCIPWSCKGSRSGTATSRFWAPGLHGHWAQLEVCHRVQPFTACVCPWQGSSGMLIPGQHLPSRYSTSGLVALELALLWSPPCVSRITCPSPGPRGLLILENIARALS